MVIGLRRVGILAGELDHAPRKLGAARPFSPFCQEGTAIRGELRMQLDDARGFNRMRCLLAPTQALMDILRIAREGDRPGSGSLCFGAYVRPQ